MDWPSAALVPHAAIGQPVIANVRTRKENKTKLNRVKIAVIGILLIIVITALFAHFACEGSSACYKVAAPLGLILIVILKAM